VGCWAAIHFTDTGSIRELSFSLVFSFFLMLFLGVDKQLDYNRGIEVSAWVLPSFDGTSPYFFPLLLFLCGQRGEGEEWEEEREQGVSVGDSIRFVLILKTIY